MWLEKNLRLAVLGLLFLTWTLVDFDFSVLNLLPMKGGKVSFSPFVRVQTGLISCSGEAF